MSISPPVVVSGGRELNYAQITATQACRTASRWLV
jgi:hypothetical protein